MKKSLKQTLKQRGINKIGYCCINETLAKEGISTNSHIRKKNFTLDKASDIALGNVKNLKKIIDWNRGKGVELFRISSQLFPFADHEEIGYTIDVLKDSTEIKEILRSCNFGRLTMHPDAFVCLASPKPDVVNRSIKNIEMHREIGETIGVSDFVINIHVGGMYHDNPKVVAARFNAAFKRLSKQAQAWLTIENDDKKSLWSPNKLHRHIFQETGTPIVFDFHHHRICNDGESTEDALNLVKTTWKSGIVPLVHYSEGRDRELDRAHSDKILELPSSNFEIDVEVEAKGKELAILDFLERN